MHIKSFEITDKPLCIFIPNFGREKYIRNLAEQFKTSLSPDEYVIIIGNDGVDHNFDDLDDLNIHWFTLHRNPPLERNGAFIRNYFIKRCRGQYLFQVDPEILLSANQDIILEMSTLAKQYNKHIIKPLYTASLDEDATIDLMNRNWSLANFVIPPEFIKKINTSSPERIHYCFGCPVALLQGIHGYSELFKYYGPEDQEIFYQLHRNGIDVVSVNNWCVTHLWHPVNKIVYENLNQMHKLFDLIKSKDVKRNTEKWGES
jgi:hypothetical protein